MALNSTRSNLRTQTNTGAHDAARMFRAAFPEGITEAPERIRRGMIGGDYGFELGYRTAQDGTTYHVTVLEVNHEGRLFLVTDASGDFESHAAANQHISGLHGKRREGVRLGDQCTLLPARYPR